MLRNYVGVDVHKRYLLHTGIRACHSSASAHTEDGPRCGQLERNNDCWWNRGSVTSPMSSSQGQKSSSKPGRPIEATFEPHDHRSACLALVAWEVNKEIGTPSLYANSNSILRIYSHMYCILIARGISLNADLDPDPKKQHLHFIFETM